jgi:hypothetical protein
MKFTTESGSTYEVDLENKRVRRLAGAKSPTERQGKDGDWRTFVGISPIRSGLPVLFIWNGEVPLLEETLKMLADGLLGGAIPGTITSPIERIL